MDFLFKTILGELYEEIFGLKKAKKENDITEELETIVKSELKDIRDTVDDMNKRLCTLTERVDCIDELILEGTNVDDALQRIVDVHKIVSENRSMINELYTIQEMMAKLALPKSPPPQKKQQDPYSLPSIKKNDDKDKLN